MGTQLLIVGLDGATLDLLEPWLSAGELPTIAKLVEGGAFGPLRSVPNMHSAAAWTSMVTGRNPGKHGLFAFTGFTPDFEQTFYVGGDRSGDAIWDILSRQGRRVGIINVPMTFPVDPVNGVMISGLDAPQIGERSVFPAELLDLYPLLRNGYESVPDVTYHLRAGRPDRAVRRWLEVEKLRTELCVDLLESADYDLFMVVCTVTDWAHHILWRYIDSQVPSYSQADAERYGGLMLQIYRQMDDMLARLLDAAGAEITAIVSDHGAGRHQRGSFFLMDWLVQNQYLVFKDSVAARKSWTERSIAYARRHIPAGLKRMLGKRIRAQLRHVRQRAEFQAQFSAVDWARTRAFAQYKWHNVWINLRGREKHGVVEPGADYDRLCARLKQDLLAWTDPETGQPVVDQVWHRDELYHGPYAERAPDFQILWKDDLVFSGYTGHADVVRRSVTEVEEFWTGDHRMDGVCILYGRNVAEGARLQDASIYDVVPTILYLMDEPLPCYLDGRVLSEAIDPLLWKAHPVTYDDSTVSLTSRAGDDVLSAREQEVLEERLRGLGYIE